MRCRRFGGHQAQAVEFKKSGPGEETGTLVAINETVDDTIGSFADNPEIQQLITTQTTGLVEEIVEEVRERTVGADLFLEGIVRMILRRKPRYQLPSPPLAVQNRAKTLRPVRTVSK